MTKIILSLLTVLCVNVTANAAVSIHITPEQVQPMDYGSHWFGRVFVNSRTSVRYTVTNTGDENLDYVSANMWGSFDFNAYHNCSGTLLPQQRCQFEIAYWPAFEGSDTGDFVLQFKQDSVQIHVWGEAVRRF
ncbi:MAG: hypothetical protein NDI63_00090 [Pseudobdellovibrio sp.]|nr:hypothetical protein [Pseudobdellovibrio sp.]